ncbi:acetyltransferase [Pelomonas sp. KK5]|uniref:acetyltransferase n=1 Tax=Pelomonas sp. KK5 TaxID=1855730 RepID=UPI00097BC94C|nr:acetyltransferase [Pelomonas sp. KK5]
MNPSSLTLVGCGAYARELINWIADAEAAGRLPPLAGFLDETPDSLDGFPYTLAYRGRADDYEPVPGEALVMAIADPNTKRRVADQLKAKGAWFATVIHPSAVIAGSARLGEGVTVCPFALVSADATVGDFVAINAMSSVGHDVQLGAFSTLSAHVDLTGRVIVGEEVFFGTGAKVLPGVKIGERAKIGAGALIMRNVKADAVMYTAPARQL